jgi:hypothetical protein
MVGGLAVVVISVAATQLIIDYVSPLCQRTIRVGRNACTRQIRRLGGQFAKFGMYNALVPSPMLKAVCFQ